MKAIGTIFITIMIAWAGVAGYNWIAGKNPVTQEQFSDAHKSIQYQFDSVRSEIAKVYNEVKEVQRNQKRMERNQETLIDESDKIRHDLDTLKGGQRQIYKVMDESKNHNLFEDLLKGL